MQHVIYKGQKREVSRFGLIDPGTPLLLTEREYEDVRQHPDYRLNKHPEVLADSERLRAECHPDRVARLEVFDLPRAKLLERIDALKREGRQVSVGAGHSDHQLRFALFANMP